VGEREASLIEEIRAGWTVGPQMQNLGDLATSLQQVGTALRHWSQENFGAVTTELTRLRQQIEELCSQNVHGNHEEIQRLRRRMDEILYREEMTWLQQSRVDWLHEGDCNTKFFHRRVVRQAKKNTIKVLRNRNDEITKDRREMEGLARDCFIDLYEAD
jgi:hypothetical protein